MYLRLTVNVAALEGSTLTSCEITLPICEEYSTGFSFNSQARNLVKMPSTRLTMQMQTRKQ